MISCVIPSFNGLSLLQKHLPDVLEALPDDSQLIISDDASSDDSINSLKRTYKLSSNNLSFHCPSRIFPDPNHLKIDSYFGKAKVGKKNIEIILIHNHRNLRFSGAVNLGVQATKYKYVLILNNDVSPEKQSIKRLIKTIKQNDAIFAVTPIEYESNERSQASGKNRLWFDKGLFQHSRAENFNAGPTAWASGGSSLLDRDKFFELSGFDHDYYPAYWEDIDLSYRAKKKGYQILFEPQAIVIHQHESTHKSVWQQHELTMISWRNADKFTWKNGDIWQRMAFILWRPYWWWLRAKDPASQSK